ncbi:MAG: response regulator [Flavobacteriales bacterium]|nr:response regulator [Flavobacteriales bacterium]MBK9289076.1 response regulator [Flavobacteriales bacterium]MBL0035895.1 response regulator [Flavobacteriales bacterium]
MNPLHLVPNDVQPLPVVLYVDDDAGNRQAFQAAFRRHFVVRAAAGFDEAWAWLGRGGVDVVISDQRMPGVTGSELLHLVKERFPLVKRMLMTGYADVSAVIDAVNRGGVVRYISKPWDPKEVIDSVDEAFATVRREREQQAWTEQLVESNRQLEFALRQRLLS